MNARTFRMRQRGFASFESVDEREQGSEVIERESVCVKKRKTRLVSSVEILTFESRDLELSLKCKLLIVDCGKL